MTYLYSALSRNNYKLTQQLITAWGYDRFIASIERNRNRPIDDLLHTDISDEELNDIKLHAIEFAKENK